MARRQRLVYFWEDHRRRRVHRRRQTYRQTGSQSDGRTGKNRSLIGLGVHKQVSIRSSMQNPLFGSLSALQPRRLKVHWPAACLYGTIRSERRASFYESARCLDRLLFWDIVEKQPHAFLSSFSISASAIRTLLLFLLLQESGAAAAKAGAILRATWGSLIVVRFRRFIRANELANFLAS